MKKLLCLLFIFTMTLGFTACENDDKDEVIIEPTPPEVFKWNGDWNDPEDTKNYKAEYNGLYNPIIGVWQYETNSKKGLQFTESFILRSVDFNDDGTYTATLPSEYKINGDAFRLSVNTYYRYKVENNDLYIAIQNVGEQLNTNWNKMKRINK